MEEGGIESQKNSNARAVARARGTRHHRPPQRTATHTGEPLTQPTTHTFLPYTPPPRFTVVHRSPDAAVEIRDYVPSVWATTTLPAGTPWLMARSDGFKRLFDYISAHGIKMTTPVVYRVSPGDGAIKAAFMLPADAVATAPRSDGAVTIEEWPAMRVAARSWAGVIDGRGVVDRQASEAAKGATAAGFATAPTPQAAPYYSVGYDGPSTPAPSRRHEVWLPVTASPEAAPVAKAG